MMMEWCLVVVWNNLSPDVANTIIRLFKHIAAESWIEIQ